MADENTEKGLGTSVRIRLSEQIDFSCAFVRYKGLTKVLFRRNFGTSCKVGEESLIFSWSCKYFSPIVTSIKFHRVQSGQGRQPGFLVDFFKSSMIMTQQYYAYQINCSTNNQNFFIGSQFFSFPGLSSVYVIHRGALSIICADEMPKAED